MCERRCSPHPLLGLAGDHRRRRDHPAARAHRRARNTPSSSGRSTSPSPLIWVVFAINFFWTLATPEREAPLRRDLVLHRDHRHRRGAAHRQQPRASRVDARLEELPGLRRRAGRAGAVVVRAQRRRVLPDHADPGHHVLLPAEGGGAAGLLATGCRSSTSGRWSSSTSGPGRTTCSTPRCPTGRRRWAWSSAHALGAVAGAACSTACSRCAAPGTSCAPTRCSSSSSPRVTFYGMATFEGPLLSIKSVNGLAHYTDWIIGHVHARRARLERLHGRGHVLLAHARGSTEPQLHATRWPTSTSGSGPSASCSTSSRCGSAAITQGLMWRAIDAERPAAVPELRRDRGDRSMPFYWMRLARRHACYLGGVDHDGVQLRHPAPSREPRAPVTGDAVAALATALSPERAR